MDCTEQLQQDNLRLRRELDASRKKIGLLEQKIQALIKRLFGQKSEQLDRHQMELLGLESPGQEKVDPQDDKEKDKPSGSKSGHSSRRIRTPEDLEVVQEIIEPEMVAADPEAWKEIDRETSRRLDFQPGKFFWRETIRPKYVRCDQREVPPVVAPAPAQVIESGLAAPGLLAHILVSRFADHLPYYRQEQIYQSRYGVFISRQQMVQWVEQSTRLLSGVTDCILNQMRESSYLQIDETPIKYRDPQGAGLHQGYLWTALQPGQAVCYDWHVSRSASCLEDLLGEDYEGLLQCDGYNAYPAYAKDKEKVDLVGCWAHVRRKFFEAQNQAPRRVGWILGQIGRLYQWEAQLRESRAGPKLREAIRQSHSQMVVDRLKKFLEKIKSRYLPESLLGKAISYAEGQWLQLRSYLKYGKAEIDNNQVENRIRPTAIGKKNWLFMGSQQAGKRNAVVYTLVENCRMHGIDPYAYLKDILERLPEATNHSVAGLTPLNWLKSRPAKSKVAA